LLTFQECQCGFLVSQNLIRNISALPESIHSAAVRATLDSGHHGTIDDQMVIDMAWEDKNCPVSTRTPDIPIDPSHEGGEYNHFIHEMIQDCVVKWVHHYTTQNYLFLQTTVQLQY